MYESKVDVNEDKEDMTDKKEVHNIGTEIQKQEFLDSLLNNQNGKFGVLLNPRESRLVQIPTCEKNMRVQLSDSIFMFPNKKISEHGNVFEGEIRSGVYGIRSCVIKFAEISEQNVREAKILSKLGSHTNVIAIVQSGTYSDILEDRFYIALDKCDEENLRQYLSNRKKAGTEFDLKQANGFARQIIDGVAYIHDNKVAHLDLKPSNILLSLNQRLVKIADFGLSRELKSTSSKLYLKSQFGTDGYRPVQSFGDSWVSLRSDIFSLGAVFYHLLSNGKEAFGDDEHKYVCNVSNNVMDTSHLLVLNPKTTEHLIKLMLKNERCRRPTIWQVAEHPCWTGNEVESNFDYGCEDELDDSDVQLHEPSSQNSDDSETELKRNYELVKALKKMRIKRLSAWETCVVIFDNNEKYLHLFNPRKSSLTRIREYSDIMKKKDFMSVAISCYIYVLLEDRSMYRFNYRGIKSPWERMADMIGGPGLLMAAVVASGSIIIAGGTGSVFTKSAVKYDPSQNRWEKLEDKQLATDRSTTVASRGYVYCLGGRLDKNVITDRVERLNVVSQSWDEVASMLEAKRGMSAVECGKMVFVAGGVNFRVEILNSVEKYDPDVNQWTAVKPMIRRRYGSWFRCHFIEGSIYAVGDEYGGIERYDIEKDEWKLVHLADTTGLFIQKSVKVKMQK